MKQRIEYLDAMRSFTMVLVVFSHVLMCSFQKPAHSGFSFNDIFSSFFCRYSSSSMPWAII